MAVSHNGQDDPDLDPEPDLHPAPQRFAAMWPVVQPLLQFTELLVDGQHEGLHLAVQALLVLGDLTAVFLVRSQRR